MKKKYIFIAFLILIVAFFFWRHSKGEKKKENYYETIVVEKKEAGGYIEAKGNVEVNDTVSVFVDKALKVKEIFVKEGDYIEKGTLLMTFDDSSRNKLRRAIEKEQLELKKLKRDYKVEKSLEKLGGASLNSLKDMKTDIRIRELNLEELQEDLEKTAKEVYSPVNGTIVSLKAQENYLVDTTEPLLKIADLSNIKIVLEIPEYHVRHVKLGEKLVIKPEIFEEKKGFSGEVTRIGSLAKVSSTTSENILEVEVKPLEEIPYLVPGFKVSAELRLESDIEGKQLMIPKTSLLKEAGKYYVLVVNDQNIVSRREVEIQMVDGSELVVLKGLQDKEKILKNPNGKIKEGEKILDSNSKVE